MSSALWSKTVRETWGSLVPCLLLLFGFSWIFVWLTSFALDLTGLANVFGQFFGMFERLAGVPLKDLATTRGKLALLYIDAVTVFTSIGWAIARGSDVVSGEVGRGTMEMLLAQPVRRSEIIGVQAAVTTIGAALLSLAVWLGIAAGLATVDLRDEPSLLAVFPASLNLFALIVAIAGLSTFISAWHRERWQTIGLVSGIVIVELIVKVVGKAWPDGGWLLYLTFLSAFEPQAALTRPDDVASLMLRHDLVLLVLGAACYAGALVVFTRWDVPAPL